MATEDFTTGSIQIISAFIYKIDGSNSINLLETPYTDEPFLSLYLNESIFSSIGIDGTFLFEDKHNYGEDFGFDGGEILVIEAETPLSDADTGDFSIDYETQEYGTLDVSFRKMSMLFYIHEASALTDDSTSEADSPDGQHVVWKLGLTSLESSLGTLSDYPFPDTEFIGKIADAEGKGLVNYLGQTYFSPGPLSTCNNQFDVEETFNHVWFKGWNIMYPWAKKSETLSILRLMNYLAENSVSGTNTNAVNYLFWQDLMGWHFRSIDSIIKTNKGKKLPVFNVSSDPAPKANVTSILQSKIIDQAELFQSNSFKSFYIREYPSYRDPYSLYMPTHSKLIKKKISYDYREEYENWNHIESNRVLPQILEDYDKETAHKITDSGSYGYFDYKEYNDQHPTVFDQYKSGSYKNSDHVYQATFDQTDLDGNLLKKIKNEILNPTKSAYAKYVLKRLLKEKWNVYKYSICCDEQPVNIVGTAEREIGYIIGFEPVNTLVREDLSLSDNPYRFPVVYKYYWTPVEVWTREEVLLNWNPEDGPYARGAPVRPINNLGITNGQPLIAVRGLTLGEVPSVFVAWNVNEMLNYQPYLPEFIPGLTGQDLEGEDPNDYSNNGADIGFRYLAPGLNMGHVALLNGYPVGLDAASDELGAPRTFNMIPVGGFLDLDGWTLPGPPTGEPENPEQFFAVSDGTIRKGKIFCHGQLVEVFKYNREQIDSAGITGNKEFIYLFNVENSIDGGFDLHRIADQDYISGITIDPYQPPSEEGEEENAP